MEPTSVSTARLDEDGGSGSLSFEKASDNIDQGDGNEETADDSPVLSPTISHSLSNSATGYQSTSLDCVNNTSSVSTGESETADLDKSSGDAEIDKSQSFFITNGPVFPARHNRELQPVTSINPVSHQESSANETNELEMSNVTKQILLPYIDTKEDGSVLKNDAIETLKESPLSEKHLDLGSVGSDNSDLTLKSRPSGSSAETENESLVPLSASFFNCQYQTPSWIDDPLIGVPPCAMENKNTHRKTGADMRILTAYMRSLNEMRLPEAIPPTELDKYLSSFFLVVRKADGSEYEPCSLRAMLASIERYLRFKNYPLSLTRDSAFSNMRNVLKLKQQTLRSIGKGQKTPNEVSPSSLAREGKIAHLFKSQEMGPYTPSSVVFTLCFYFCMYLRIRKSTENKKLLWGDIILCKDDNGREFLTFSSQMLRRFQGSSKGNLRQRSYRVWADPSCPEKDPITIYKFYAQKRPPSMNTNFAPFYLGINVLYPTQGQLWYRPAAMGINKLNEMVRQIRDITGIRSTADFHGDIKIADKQKREIDNNSQDDHSPSNESAERQDSESDIKTEVMDEGEDEDQSSTLAIDFSQEHHDSQTNFNQQSEMMPTPSHLNLAALGNLAHSVYSDDDSNDSYSHQSFPLKVNGDIASDVRHDREIEQEIDLTKANSPDSPLNCSTKDRTGHLEGENMMRRANSVCIGMEEAKQHLISIVRRLESHDIIHFNSWLKGVNFISDPASGQVVVAEGDVGHLKEPLLVSARSNSVGQSGTNITLNISLSPQALQGEGPITVTAQTCIPSEQQRNYSSSTSSKSGSNHGRQSTALSKNLPSFTQNVSTLPGHTSPEKPLDLVTSSMSRNGKIPSSSSSSLSGTSSQQVKSNRSHNSNGIFPSGSSCQENSPLAKRMRLSAEQAEAYTSASIMASLSSASFLNERLRLQLMQAGLHMGDYNMDPNTGGFMDLAGSEAIRSQLLQHYGIKSEPK